MDHSTQTAAFDSLVDQGIDPDTINDDMIQIEIENLTRGGRTPADAALETWRFERARELFYHVEIMVERLRHLVDNGQFHHGCEETRETIGRLNLSARSIHHMANPEDAALLRRRHQPGAEAST